MPNKKFGHFQKKTNFVPQQELNFVRLCNPKFTVSPFKTIVKSTYKDSRLGLKEKTKKYLEKKHNPCERGQLIFKGNPNQFEILCLCGLKMSFGRLGQKDIYVGPEDVYDTFFNEHQKLFSKDETKKTVRQQDNETHRTTGKITTTLINSSETTLVTSTTVTGEDPRYLLTTVYNCVVNTSTTITSKGISSSFDEEDLRKGGIGENQIDFLRELYNKGLL